MGLGFIIGLGFRTSGILSAANTKGPQIKGLIRDSCRLSDLI